MTYRAVGGDVYRLSVPETFTGSGDSPAEPQTMAMVCAIAREELVTLSTRSWPRADVGLEVERMRASFEIVEARP